MSALLEETLAARRASDRIGSVTTCIGTLTNRDALEWADTTG
jgi:hypothetical protein